MEQAAVFHKSGSNYAYAYDAERLHLKLQTKAGDVQEVSLVYGDPYDFRECNKAGEKPAWEWFMRRSRMEKVGSDGIHDFWFLEIKPEAKRLRYAFYLISDGQPYLYTERWLRRVIGYEDPYLRQPLSFFVFPYIHSVDVYQAPNWVKDTVWYQIFPERFANGDRANDPEKVKDWKDNKVTPGDFYGGDLRGVIDHLDYLKDLGINGIYFTPIFKSPSNHKYNTRDYLAVDPHFGDEELLRKLVEEAHARGIRVMLDIVFNHCGFYFEQFQDVVEHGEASPYKDWFHIRRYPVFDGSGGSGHTGPDSTGFDFTGSDSAGLDSTGSASSGMGSPKELNYETFAFTPDMPKLNTANPDTKEYLLKVIRHWSDIAPIDGWRLDVANEVDHRFWREFREVVKERNPEAYILGEVWHDANPWLEGDQFDAVMNYPLRDAVVGFFAEDELDSQEFAGEVTRMQFGYPRHVYGNLYNLIDSHDTARFVNQAGERRDRLKLAYLFLLTYQGVPSVYYGDEVGMTGGQDPDCRRPMVWEEEEQDAELLEFMKKLLRLRRKHDVLRGRGEIRFLPTGHPELLLYQRYTREEVYSILINRSDCGQSLLPPERMRNQSYEDLWRGERVILSDRVEMEPCGFYVLKSVELF